MKMKSLVLATLLTATPALVLAGPGFKSMSVEDREAQRTERLVEVLQLRPDQVEPVKEILNAQREQAREVRQQHQQQRQEMRKATALKLGEVLDDTQLARFEGFAQGKIKAHAGRGCAQGQMKFQQ